MEQLLQYLHPKTVSSSPEQFFKNSFLSYFYSDKMRWEQCWSKQLYVLFIVKTWNFTERDISKDLTYSSKIKYIKIHQDIMINTSRWHHWVNIGDFIAKFENVEIYFGNWHPPKNYQNLGSFQEKYQHGSFVIVKPLPLRFDCNFAYVSETYDFMELYYDL